MIRIFFRKRKRNRETEKIKKGVRILHGVGEGGGGDKLSETGLDLGERNLPVLIL